MRRFGRLAAGFLMAAALIVPAASHAININVTGVFEYEDRIYDGNGYTGTAQDLPIRYADVEVVRSSDSAVLGSGSTDSTGAYSIVVDLPVTTDLYVRCLSSTDNHVDYHIKVVDTFVRSGGTVDLSGSTIHAITTSTQSVDPLTPATGDFGTFLIQDTTGSGVAQAYNILDNGVDAFDYLNTPGGIGRFPTAGEFVVFGWNFTTGSGGSNYFWQGIFITATASDTDGWSDTVILHEAGHWASDMFGADSNPGGSHFIGDNFQDPRLSYGEGYATFFCAQVREFRSTRLNKLAVEVDDHVSFYADLGIPPVLPTPGGLEFAYDFENGLFSGGAPIGQVGSANETNVTTAMWDLVDGAATRDESPGVDDDPGDETGALSWDVVQNYMTSQAGVQWLTVEDFYDGWFVQHGSGFMQTEVDSAFIGLAGMPFFVDASEPDDTIAQADTATCLTYSTTGSSLVINECDLGAEDKIEIYNSTNAAVDMTGWTIHTYRNGFTVRSYTFPTFTLYPGAFVVVHELGDPINDTATNLFGGSGFSVVWFNTDDGACTLEDSFASAVDFVRWDNTSGGDPNTTPTPGGTGFSGTLFSSFGGLNLGRDKDGTDTDAAADFASIPPSMGAPNFASVPRTTIYPTGDVDVSCLDLGAGDLVVVSVSAAHSAGEPRLELLSENGVPAGQAQASNGVAEIQFLAPVDTAVYVRVSNAAPYSEYTPLDVLVYKRPSAQVLAPPVALVAVPDNAVDVADAVELSWFNGSAYDSVEVSRDGSPIAILAGNATSYSDNADRGLHTYDVAGFLGGSQTTAATYITFAGTIPCFTSDSLETGSANLVADSPWAITGTIAADGAFSLHDSPAGNYGDGINISVALIEPADLLTAPNLQFDHICITEATFDFGYVELSTDFGNNWTQLAVYDMDDHAGWNDGVANAGDWIHENIDLSTYLGQKVRVRFRLETDGFVNEDGWYIDNISMSDTTCTSSSAVGDPVSARIPLLRAYPNPFGGRLNLAMGLSEAAEARVQVFDIQGKLVRTLHDGLLQPGANLTWDGRSGSGRPVAAGFYLVRGVSGRESLVQRVVKIR